jgi:hypothetical protein
MAQTIYPALKTLLCLLVITACAEGTPPITDNNELTDSAAGSTSGGGDQAQGGGSSGAGLTAGATDGGSANAGGSPNTAGSANAGSSNGGASGGARSTGGASGAATAGASAMGGSSTGGSASGGAGTAGKGGSSAGGSSGNANGGASAGSGGSGAACSGAKPESNCVCHTNGGNDYWFCPTARDFADGESKCVGAGLHMVRIANALEDKWVNDTANAASFGEYYLGGTDATTPNTWTWLAGGTFWTGLANGTVTGYAHWGSSQPDGSGTCVVVQSNFVWDDRICTDHRLYICK